METDRLLAIDVGLTNVKAVVFDASGGLICRTSVGYPTKRPEPDAVEQDPASWWSAMIAATTALPAEVTRTVTAMGVTGHMHALVCIRADGRPVGPSLVLGDRRAAPDATEVTRRVGADQIYAITGAELDASMPAAKVRFLKRRDPSAWASVTHLLGCKDYLRLQLTGQLATEPIDACATSLFDIRAGRWSPDLIDAVEIRESMLPPVDSPWSAAGPLLGEAASLLGLRPGLPVVVGAGDDVVVLGFGLLDPGTALEHIGTTGSVMAVTDRPIGDPQRGLELYPHALPDRWVVGGSHTTAGAALAWAADLLGYASVDDALSCLGTRHEAGISFVPTLAGERFPVRVPEARGAWVGLPLGVTRQDLMQASFQGVATTLQAILERIDQVAGHQAVIRAAVADDERWLAMRAASYRRPVEVSTTSEPTALGLACLVAVAAGTFPDPRAAVSAMTHVARSVPPGAPTAPPLLDPEPILRRAWKVASVTDEADQPLVAVGSRSRIPRSRDERSGEGAA